LPARSLGKGGGGLLVGPGGNRALDHPVPAEHPQRAVERGRVGGLGEGDTVRADRQGSELGRRAGDSEVAGLSIETA
jgi:hypothetical protein